jgi:carboxyl-terminal processing protease
MNFDQQNNSSHNNQELAGTAGPRSAFKIKAIAGVLILVIASYIFGYNMGHKGFVFVPKQFEVVNQNTLPQTVDYSLLTDAINVLNSKYIDKPVDQQKILYGAISGAIASVGDPYTSFFDPKSLQNFQTSLKGSFDGIGAEVGKQNDNIVIIAPLDSSPAQKAGLKAKDIIAAVDGKSTAGQSVDQVVQLIRGQKGTSVKLTIVRGQEKPFDVTIVRDQIKVKSVNYKYQDVASAGKTKHVAIITISQFGDDTTSLFNQAVNDVLKHSVDGIVVDLRNNPGGYLQSAVDVASAWVAEGKTVVTEAHSDGTSQTYSGEGSNRLAGIKTVVLINGGSASAAEILSGALHDDINIPLVGEKSFGKGSVQELMPLKDGSAIKVTIAKWITPGGKNLNHDGLNPDVPVTLNQAQVDKGQDPQMDKAVEEVSK